MTPAKLGIIGGGNMGAAIVRGALRAGVLHKDQLIVAETDVQKREMIGQMGCRTTDDARNAAHAEQVLLAVKPQSFPALAETTKGLLRADIVISIMAGLHSEGIHQRLGAKSRVIRAMPNTPCQVGAGMTAIALGAGSKPGDEALAVALFDSLGRTVMLDEQHMHAVTAVSGSGPAYVFLLAEAMEQAALELDLPADAARLLVSQTVIGAGRLLSESSEDAAALRQAVTSPGGTTAAALDVMNSRGLKGIVIDALRRARDRGVELGRAQ